MPPSNRLGPTGSAGSRGLQRRLFAPCRRLADHPGAALIVQGWGAMQGLTAPRTPARTTRASCAPTPCQRTLRAHLQSRWTWSRMRACVQVRIQQSGRGLIAERETPEFNHHHSADSGMRVWYGQQRIIRSQTYHYDRPLHADGDEQSVFVLTALNVTYVNDFCKQLKAASPAFFELNTVSSRFQYYVTSITQMSSTTSETTIQLFYILYDDERHAFHCPNIQSQPCMQMHPQPHLTATAGPAAPASLLPPSWPASLQTQQPTQATWMTRMLMTLMT